LRVGLVMTTSLPTAAHTISRERRVAAPATSETAWLATMGLDGGIGIYPNLMNHTEGSYGQISTQGLARIASLV
jgi:hypothetical protein